MVQWEPEDEDSLHVNVWDCGGQDEYWRVRNLYLFRPPTRPLFPHILQVASTTSPLFFFCLFLFGSFLFVLFFIVTLKSIVLMVALLLRRPLH